MSKVIITLGNTPADCKLEVDGVTIDNAVSINASVDIDSGPGVSYTTVTDGPDGITEEINNVEFDAVIDKRVGIQDTTNILNKVTGEKE